MIAATSTRRSIIVAGGGIGGLAAAIGLSRAGFEVTVLERASEFREIGAGIQLGPNVFNALKALGVAEQTLSNAVYIDRLIMMDGVTGDKIAEVPVDEPFRKHFNNPLRGDTPCRLTCSIARGQCGRPECHVAAES